MLSLTSSCLSFHCFPVLPFPSLLPSSSVSRVKWILSFFLSLRLNSHPQNPLKIIWAPLGRWGILQVLTNSHKSIKCTQECSGHRVQVTVEPCSRPHQTKQKPQKMCKNVLNISATSYSIPPICSPALCHKNLW